MGHKFVIARDTKYGKYFIRRDGGSSGIEWSINHEKKYEN